MLFAVSLPSRTAEGLLSLSKAEGTSVDALIAEYAEMMMSAKAPEQGGITATLAERGTRYGEFPDHASGGADDSKQGELMSEHTGCCGNPATCEQPCFHSAGRTTPGQPGGIASVPQSLAEVRSSDGWTTWGGGMMPATGMVEVRYRNGVTNTDDAASFLWYHRDCPDDIVAYRIAIPAPQYDPRDVSFNPLDKQVGGNHYRDMAIQPVQFIVANNIPYREANVIKYACRHASKNGKQDLLKARHYIDMLIADYEDAE